MENLSWPVSGRMPRLLTFERDFMKHMFCFAASYNSLPPDDRYETILGEYQEIDGKRCGALCQHFFLNGNVREKPTVVLAQVL